jgi:hypothetical protein
MKIKYLNYTTINTKLKLTTPFSFFSSPSSLPPPSIPSGFSALVSFYSQVGFVWNG